ncbi:hypothetical protein E2C01_084988 [Portunus trituberculatus]|uniref:Uncharacterized protein n=1 Tax=Portunus trituberculatus TaxID=210409 RepID=A0A5B7IWS5_PORTR|nr:hypothetical protein [Portunus trituberculatus]
MRPGTTLALWHRSQWQRCPC